MVATNTKRALPNPSGALVAPLELSWRNQLLSTAQFDQTKSATASACKICGEPAPLFDVVDFNKVCAEPNHYLYGLTCVPVYYYRCCNCGLMFTRFFDDWGKADFLQFVYNEDYIRIDGDYVQKRPFELADKLVERLPGLADLRILDYGSGSGAFATRLIEQGIRRVECYDPFSHPTRPSGQFDLTTCLEVLQHSPHPEQILEDMRSFMAHDGAIILVTSMQPDNIDLLRGNWIYAAPRNGHSTLYTEPALIKFAEENNLHVCSGGGMFALVSPRNSAITSLITHGIGPVTQNVMVQSPSAEAELGWRRGAIRSQWRPIEQSEQGPFRWTTTRQIEWPLDRFTIYPCRVIVSIPILMELIPDFAAQSTLSLDGETVSVKRSPEGMWAEFLITEERDLTLVLETPELSCPDELGTVPGDTRKLGLAVPVGD
jgi:hypothetical protein